MKRGETRWDEAIPAYRRHYELSKGSRQDRLRAHEEYWWACEAVSDGVRDGTLPLTVLDALVCDLNGDSDYRAYIAAGPLEDLLNWHADTYAHAFADRARTNDWWAEALRGVWLHSADWAALPEGLRRLIPEPRTIDPAVPGRQRRAGRRQNNRQGRRGNGRG